MLHSMGRTVVPESRRLIALTMGIPGLGAQYGAATEVRDDIQRRLGGDRSAGGEDDFARRLRRINRRVNAYFARHPDAAPRRRGHDAALDPEVLQAAANRLTGFETMIGEHSVNGAEALKVLAHIQDISVNAEVHPAVIEAACTAKKNDPADLVAKLTALVRNDPPILSTRTRW